MQEQKDFSNPSSVPDDLTGLAVGRFVVEGRIGSGGMGQVYRAQDTTLKRVVAIKRMAHHLRLSDLERQRFLKEAQRASALNHPNIAAVHDVLEFDGELFLVMELVEGTTLRERMQTSGGVPIGISEFLQIAKQCAEGLSAAHQRGIIHGDIKPENIMIAPGGLVKILDFGVARRISASATEATQTLATRTGFTSGTPAYMAPEVLQQQPSDGRADLFSLGVVFYELLGGVQPFASDSFATTVGRVLHVEAPPIRELNNSIPDDVSELVSRLLEKDPSRRQSNAQSLLSELKAIQAAPSKVVRKVPVPGQSPPSKRRFAWFAAGCLLLIVLLTALGWVYTHKRIRPTVETTNATNALPQVRILAILPVSSADSDPKMAALARGLVQSIAAKMGRISDERALEVIPASNMQDKGITSLADARKQFGATLGLTVDLQQSSGMIRVAYSLLDALSGRILGSDSVVIPASDIFALEDNVAQGIMKTLGIQLRPDEQAGLKMHGTTVPAAYDLYLQSRGYLLNFTIVENVDNAILLLKQAVKLDPNFGMAKAALGEAYWRKYWHTKQPSWTQLARTECGDAVKLGNAGAAGHSCLGLVSEGTGKYAEAAEEYRRTVELDPSDENARIGLGLALEHDGKIAEAEKSYKASVDKNAQSWISVNALGTFYYRQKDLAKAVEAFKKVTSLAPEGYAGFVNLGAVYNTNGQQADAIDVLKKSIILRPSYAGYVNLGNAYFWLHDFAEASKAYEEATRLNPKQYPTWGNLAEAHYYSGAKDKAAPAYRKAIELAKDELKVNPNDSGVLGYIAGYYSMLGDRKQSLHYLEQALHYGSKDKEIYMIAASVYNQFGDTGLALEWLAKSVQSGYPPQMLKNSPVFMNLANNPRYQELMRSAPRNP
jgi:serine/threonine protein kinase/tetratricopeptide (TPR) repeat protein